MTEAQTPGPAVGQPLLETRGLTVEYKVRHAPPLRAVDDVNLTVAEHETVGLVGESGSGKSTIARAILNLTPVKEGAVVFSGADITHASERERRRLSRELQVVFQDPYSSLSPTRTVRQTLYEPTRVHHTLSRAELDERVQFMLEKVGLPLGSARRYPAQFSGGQRQRIAIARALMVQPRLVICDEPTSALDLSVQAQVLNLLRELQAEFHLSYLFISHDLAVVRHVAHRIVVLYHGRIMEQGDASVLYRQPRHPYTQALLQAAPVPDPEQQRQRRLARVAARSAATATTVVPANACPFAPRCPHAVDICRTVRPQLETTRQGVQVACHRWEELAASASDQPVATSAARPS